jgi:hypothetical protein
LPVFETPSAVTSVDFVPEPFTYTSSSFANATYSPPTFTTGKVFKSLVDLDTTLTLAVAADSEEDM